MAITYLIVRHGEAEGNREHRFIGQSDVALSALGVRQAAAVSERLATMPITAIISSDLQRASRYGTAARRSARHPHSPRPRPQGDRQRGMERHAPIGGHGEVAGRCGLAIEGVRMLQRPGGERWADVQRRAITSITTDLHQRDHGDVVVVATHGGPALGLVKWVSGLLIEPGLFNGPFGPVSNASITTIELPTKRLIGLNDVGHLGDLARRMKSPFERAVESLESPMHSEATL